jgi:hypothetical protein
LHKKAGCSRPLDVRKKACLLKAALEIIDCLSLLIRALQVLAFSKLLWEHFRSPQVEK